MPIMSLDIGSLQSDLARVPAGTPVHLSLLTSTYPTDSQIQDLVQAFTTGGIEMLSSPKAMTLNWDGYEVSAVDLNFRAPATPAPGTTAFWPVLIFALVAIGGAGYLIWKAGDIADDTAQAVMKKLPWILAILGGIWLLSKNMEKKPARR
jgi:hypothetical protein